MTALNNANVYLPGTIQIPSAALITAITRANPMVVTITQNASSQANTYIPGQLVRLTIPITYGMWQADGLIAKITEINGSSLTLDVDSRNFDTFSVPGGGNMVYRPASLSPSGSRNLEFDNSTKRVPFQSLNNRGN